MEESKPRTEGGHVPAASAASSHQPEELVDQIAQPPSPAAAKQDTEELKQGVKVDRM